MKARVGRQSIPWQQLTLWYALLLSAGLALAGWLVAVPWPAWAHDPYSSWRKPDNPAVSCCHGIDCRPTRAFMGEDGRWRAWDGLGWVIVPPGTVLPTDLAGDGRSHLCERAGRVLCFSPTTPKG
jgi:hypothetical protein